MTVIPRDKQGTVTPVRQRRSIAEKRRIVEETLAEGAATVAGTFQVKGTKKLRSETGFGCPTSHKSGRSGKPGALRAFLLTDFSFRLAPLCAQNRIQPL